MDGKDELVDFHGRPIVEGLYFGPKGMPYYVYDSERVESIDGSGRGVVSNYLRDNIELAGQLVKMESPEEELISLKERVSFIEMVLEARQ